MCILGNEEGHVEDEGNWKIDDFDENKYTVVIWEINSLNLFYILSHPNLILRMI